MRAPAERVEGNQPEERFAAIASYKASTTLDKMSGYTLEPVGFIRSTLKRREEAPRQGPEHASAAASG